MAKDVSNNITYYLLLDVAHQSALGAIRAWENVKVAFEGSQVWVKDFDYVQISALEVQSMPYKTIFYEKEGKLFLINSLLPDRNIPALLWTPIERALPIELPKMNHNFFGIKEKISLKIVPTDIEMPDNVMITTILQLKSYIVTAGAVRTKNLTWTLLNDDKVLLLGTPLLPLSGDTFWQNGDFLLPSGYDFDLHILSETLSCNINPYQQYWIVWNVDNSYFLIPKSDLEQLSLASFNITFL